MNEIAEYKHIYQQCNKFNHELAQIIAGLDRMRAQKIGILLGLPGMVFAVLKHSRDSQNIIDEIKAAFFRCRCDGNKNIRDLSIQIGEKLLDLATEARDQYCSLNESASRIAVIRFLLCKAVQNTLIDWDDLVEDLTISSDMECRDIMLRFCQSVL
jgi:hypothetical protein